MSNESPAVILYDSDGHPVGVVLDGAIYKLQTAARLHDGTGFYKATTPSDTQPISATALPLPDGAATAAKQDTGNTSLGNIDGKTPALVSGRVPTDGSGVTQPISAAALPLPSGAATETTLAAIKNTDGVKKITDALPTGDNRVGRVKLTDDTNVAGIDAQNHQYVGGKSAPGVAPSSNPVSVSGVDGGGLKRTVLTDTNGRVQVAGSGTGGSQQVEGMAAVAATPVGNPVWFGGNDGTPKIRGVLTDAKGRLVTAAPGAVAVRSGFVYGTVTTSATTNVPVRATTYNEQTTNGQRSIASANAADAAAGTGARKVKITYFDQTGAGPFEETLTLNGTTGVNTVATNICFIEKMEVIEVGSGGVNAGIITLYTAINKGGTTIGTIAAGDNRTFWAHHYVPTGMTCFITSLGGSNNNASNGTLLSVRSQVIGVATSPNLLLTDVVRAGPGNVQAIRPYGTPVQVVGPVRLLAYAQPEGTPNIINRASFDFYEQAT